MYDDVYRYGYNVTLGGGGVIYLSIRSATERLVTRARHLVDVKKEDGFAALHLAALNGHKDVAGTLLSPSGGCAKVDLRNNRRQTALHLATSQAHWSLVELLIDYNADITNTDEDGDTALHIAVAKSPNQPSTIPTPESSRDSPIIYGVNRIVHYQKPICSQISSFYSFILIRQ